jgi:hypothetical protein
MRRACLENAVSVSGIFRVRSENFVEIFGNFPRVFGKRLLALR